MGASGSTAKAPGRLRRWLRAPFRVAGGAWEWTRVRLLRRAPRHGRPVPLLVASKRQSERKREARRALVKRLAASALKITIVVLLLGAALVMFFEKRMIFPAQRYPDGPWADADRELAGRQEVELVAEDGMRLHGWWVPVADAKKFPRPLATVLFFHGNAGNLSHRIGWLAWLRARGYQVFAIDYRGYGKSDGSPSEKGCYRDARAAYDYVTKQRGVPPGGILLMGRSLGCAVAVELAGDPTRPVAALALESPFASIGAMSKMALPVVPVRWVLATRFDNLAKVPQLRQPLFVVVRSADDVVPAAQGRAVFEAAGGSPKELYEAPGALHNDPVWEQLEYGRRFDDFVKAHVRK